MKVRDWLQLYPLFRVALALIVGLVAGDSFGLVVPTWLWLVIVSSALLIALASYRWKTAQGVAILFTVMCFGFLLMTMQKNRLAVPISEEEHVSEAVLMTTPKVRGKVVQCDLYVLSGPLSSQKVRASILRDTVERRYEALKVGDGVRFRSAFQPIQSYPSNSHFNYQRWMAIRGYRAQTFIYHRDWAQCQLDLTCMPRFERLRLKAQKVREKLLSHYAAHGFDDQDYAVLAAMTLGEKSFLSKQTKEIFSISGASHVLALSGLHLSIIYGLLVLVLGGRGLRRVFSLAFVVLTVWVYVFLTGMSSSVMRSAIMLTVYSLVSLLNRDKMSLNALSLTAIVMLLLHPLSLWDVGFQLSFMAVAAILLLYRPIERWMPEAILVRSAVVGKLWGMMAVSLAAQLGTAPLVAYYFGRFSCYFLLTNLLVIPLTVLILYTSCLLFALSFAPLLQSVVAVALTWMAQLLNHYLSFLASWPGASVEGIHINVWQLALIYVIIACVCWVASYLRQAYVRSRIT